MKKHLIIILFCFFILSIYVLFHKICYFQEAYEIGYSCAQDEFCDSGEYTEGGFKYWETNAFWIEQGYEEGYKKGMRTRDW